jgi:hypothetical protein
MDAKKKLITGSCQNTFPAQPAQQVSAASSPESTYHCDYDCYLADLIDPYDQGK